MKGQTVRLIDVFFIGPYLVYIGNKSKNKTDQLLLTGIGIATVIYNGYNYLIIKQNEKK